MAQAIRTEKLAPADELRTLLEESEKLLPALPGSGARAVELLEKRDRMAELWPQIEAMGVDLRPEVGRLGTLDAQIHRAARRIVRELDAAGGIRALRQQRFAGAEAPWWWQLDLEVRDRLIQRGRSTLTTAVIVLVIAAVGIFAFNKVFPTDPRVSASSAKQMAGQQAVQSGGDVQEALANFQEAANLTPNDPEPWIWVGVTQQKLGHESEASQAFARARTLLGNEADFRLARASVYAGFMLDEQATADIDFVLAQRPEDPRAHYYLAGIYENQGQLTKALEELEKTSKYAEASNQTELTAIARYRMGMLMQAVQVRGELPTPTPTATPAR